MRLSIGGVIEQGQLCINHVELYVLGRVVEADIVKAAGAAQRAAIHIVLAPF